MTVGDVNEGLTLSFLFDLDGRKRLSWRETIGSR